MKAAVLGCFGHHYDIRIKYVKKTLEDCGYDVDIFSSDYEHMRKAYVDNYLPDINYIHVPAYKKNLSFARLQSHYVFSRSVRKVLEKNAYDLVYCVVPPNSIVSEIGKYKQKNKNVRFIADIFDMWPETFPSGSAKKILAVPFNIWRSFRDKRLSCADMVLCECDLFKNRLEEINPSLSCKTLYLCKAVKTDIPIAKDKDDVLDLVYLGSVNNIIDIDFIEEIVKRTCSLRDVRMHIIGGGEKYNEFVDRMCSAGAKTFTYGEIYDEEEKKNIFKKCDFAFNIMKKDVFVGLTMKSMDYFSYALPIINNIGGDSLELVEKNNMGFNVTSDNIDDVVLKLNEISNDEIYEMKENVLRVHEQLFTEEVFYNNLKEYIKNISL